MSAIIENIIFDLGGVLLQIDYKKTEDAFTALGFTSFSDFYKQDYVSQLFNDIEIGKIDEQEFCEGLRKISHLPISNAHIIEAWNAMLGSFYTDRLVWLQQLKLKYRLYLFSNTNVIHYNAFMAIFKNTYKNEDFNNYFIKDYYSQTLGLRKPHVEAYEYILKENYILPENTLFIDDTYKNIEGAKQAKLQTLWLQNDMNLQVEVEKLLL